MTRIEHFGEDARGHDDHAHGQASKSKETLQQKRKPFWAIFDDLSTIANMLGTKSHSIARYYNSIV
jgi:hypothetical protein